MNEIEAEPYLLETSLAVNLIRAGQVAPAGACISVLTLAELNNGAAKSRNPKKERERINHSVGFAKIITISEQTATIYSEKWRELDVRGAHIKIHDLWNAALAIELGIALHGCDHHFERVSHLKYVHIK